MKERKERKKGGGKGKKEKGKKNGRRDSLLKCKNDSI